MKPSLIQQSWDQVIAETFPEGFCCDGHGEILRTMYFTGAMAAMNALTGWDPARPQILTVCLSGIASVCDELTEEYHAGVAAGQEHRVRH